MTRSLQEILFRNDLEYKPIVIFDAAGQSLCKALLSVSEYKQLEEEGIDLESSSVNHKWNYTGSSPSCKKASYFSSKLASLAIPLTFESMQIQPTHSMFQESICLTPPRMMPWPE